MYTSSFWYFGPPFRTSRFAPSLKWLSLINEHLPFVWIQFQCYVSSNPLQIAERHSGTTPFPDGGIFPVSEKYTGIWVSAYSSKYETSDFSNQADQRKYYFDLFSYYASCFQGTSISRLHYLKSTWEIVIIGRISSKSFENFLVTSWVQ